MVAAMLVPIHIALTGIAVPLGWLSEPQALYQLWPVKLYLFVLIALSFFHCSHRIYQPLFHLAHRVYHSLPSLALQIIRKPVAVLVYGAALTGAVATAWILLG